MRRGQSEASLHRATMETLMSDVVWEAEDGYLSSLFLQSAELLNGTLKVGLVYS